MLKSLVAVAAVAVTTTALAVAPAMADPVNSHGKAVAPKAYDIVGVGADTDDTLLDQLSVDYNAAHHTHTKNHPWIYSWDATPPNRPTDLTTQIRTKASCGKILRPDGTGAGLSDFETPVKTANKKYDCIDFARAASPRSKTDPAKGPNGVLFVRLASDAETYARNATTNAPKSLTPAQLVAIYTCTATTWNEVGGTSHATIHPLLPPSSSGVAKFWLKALGGITVGSCVNAGVSSPQQNEGTAKDFKGANAPNVLVPYSVGKYIAQVHHDAAVGKKPKKGQNEFGRDEHGTLVLGAIKVNGKAVAPTVGSKGNTKINSRFPEIFQRPLYDVVWWAKTRDNIPKRLEPIFASATARVKGWFCASKTAKKAIASYGFLATVVCGIGS